MMIKIGIIGLGFMGKMHAAAYQLLPSEFDFQITAVADTDRERADQVAQNLNVKAYYSPRELIENADVNTVDICLPTWLHFEFASLALAKGLNIFVEKPLCLNAKDAFALVKQAEEMNVFAQVGQCLRFWPDYEYLKTLVDENRYGKMKHLKLRRFCASPNWGGNKWMSDEQLSGGAILDLQIHDVDFALYLCGKPETIKAFTNPAGEKYATIVSELRYKDFSVMTDVSWDFPSSFPFEMSYMATFEKAAVIYHSAYGLKVFLDDGTSFSPELPKGCTAKNDAGGNVSDLGGYYSELYYFIDCINKGVQPVKASLLAGAEAIELIEQQKIAAK